MEALADDGYPSEAELKAVREMEDFKELMEFVRQRWKYDAWEEAAGNKFASDGRWYRIATMGWSGNEDLIEAMQKNTIFWMLCWEMSKCGGYHEFFVPEG